MLAYFNTGRVIAGLMIDTEINLLKKMSPVI